MDWQDITEFDGIDPTESYVLGWSVKDDQVKFQVDFALSPDHPAYSPPPPTEYDCFRLGTLLFNNVESVRGLPEQSSVRPAIDASGEADYGHIEAFLLDDDTYKIEFEFGSIHIKAKSLSIFLSK